MGREDSSVSMIGEDAVEERSPSAGGPAELGHEELVLTFLTGTLVGQTFEFRGPNIEYFEKILDAQPPVLGLLIATQLLADTEQRSTAS